MMSEGLELPLGMTKIPDGWPLASQAFIDFALYSAGKEDVLAQFTADTGIVYKAPGNGLDAMISEASGHNKKVLQEFLDWLTTNYWGEQSSPTADV